MTQARTVIQIPRTELNLPLAESAPAASNHGAAGRGIPICSRNTTANRIDAPCLIRNSLVSLIPLSTKVRRKLHSRYGSLRAVNRQPDFETRFAGLGFKFNF